MTLKFRKVQRKVLSGDDKDKVKTYAMARSSNYCDMDKLCEDVYKRQVLIVVVPKIRIGILTTFVKIILLAIKPMNLSIWMMIC